MKVLTYFLSLLWGKCLVCETQWVCSESSFSSHILLTHSILYHSFTFGDGMASCSSSLPSNYASLPVIFTFKDLPILPGNNKIPNHSQNQEFTVTGNAISFYQTTTALTTLPFVHSHTNASGLEMPEPSRLRKLLLVASSGRSHLTQK